MKIRSTAELSPTTAQENYFAVRQTAAKSTPANSPEVARQVRAACLLSLSAHSSAVGKSRTAELLRSRQKWLLMKIRSTAEQSPTTAQGNYFAVRRTVVKSALADCPAVARQVRPRLQFRRLPDCRTVRRATTPNAQQSDSWQVCQVRPTDQQSPLDCSTCRTAPAPNQHP